MGKSIILIENLQKGIKHVEDMYNFTTSKFYTFSHTYIQNSYDLDDQIFLNITLYFCIYSAVGFPQ